MADPGGSGWFQRRRNQDLLYYALVAICALLLVVDLAVARHGYFALDGWFGFHALYGIVVCFLVVGIGRLLRGVVMRSEDYYER